MSDEETGAAMLPPVNDDDDDDDNNCLDRSSAYREAATMLKSLSVQQKIRLVSGLGMWELKPVPSLGIPAISVADGPHGLRKQVDADATDLLRGRIPATCFPTASALACTWDPYLVREVGEALGKECLVEGVGVLLGPGMNIVRHPCGGRTFEYWSEDPFLTGRLAAAMVEGIQSQGVSACVKHFCVNSHETDRFVADAIVDMRSLRELYWSAFEYVIKQSNPLTVMCAYNKLNGVYCSEHAGLFQELLRSEWKYSGVVMTDWGAANCRWKGIGAGVDLEMPGSKGAFDEKTLEAYRDGRLSGKRLDESSQRILALMLKGKQALSRQEKSQKNSVGIEAHHAIAHKAALGSVVLLKNNGSLLPIDPAGTGRIAVIGNFAKEPRIQGMGSSQVLPNRVDDAFTAVQGIVSEPERLVYAEGWSTKPGVVDTELIDEATLLAKDADIALLFVGLPDGYESEAFDRKHMRMPESHCALITAVSSVNPSTIVVLTNGSPIEMPWAPDVPVILEGWLTGQAGGSAIADILFGKAAPSGKLAQTFPVVDEDLPSHQWSFPNDQRQIQYHEGLNVGYRYYSGATNGVRPLFPFGHGLSYTDFAYESLQVDVSYGKNEGMMAESNKTKTDMERETKTATATEASSIVVNVSVAVRNVGNREGAEIVQCYVHDAESSVYRPEHELKGFAKVGPLQPNDTAIVSIRLLRDAFAFWDVTTASWVVEAGRFDIRIGSSSSDIRLEKPIHIASSLFSAQTRLSSFNDGLPILKTQIEDDEDENDGDDGKNRNSSSPFPIDSQEAQLGRRSESMPPSSDSHEAFTTVVGYDNAHQSVTMTSYGYNSLLREVEQTWLGRILANSVRNAMIKNMEDSTDENQRLLLEEVAGATPLRALVIFSRGAITFHTLDLLLAMMNAHYGTVFRLLPFVLWCSIVGRFRSHRDEV